MQRKTENPAVGRTDIVNDVKRGCGSHHQSIMHEKEPDSVGRVDIASVDAEKIVGHSKVLDDQDPDEIRACAEILLHTHLIAGKLNFEQN